MEAPAMHMPSRVGRLVYGVTIFRLLAGVLVASLAAQAYPVLLALLVCIALLSDVVDGWLARSLKVESAFGAMLDLVADKALTATLLLVAASRGVDLLPLTIIACRDLIMLGMRTVSFEGKRLLPTSRWFGAMLMVAVGCLTVSLLLMDGERAFLLNRIGYWIVAAAVIANTTIRLWIAAPNMQKAARVVS
jgi:phosphatidylglycerophosphate synthase